MSYQDFNYPGSSGYYLPNQTSHSTSYHQSTRTHGNDHFPGSQGPVLTGQFTPIAPMPSSFPSGQHPSQPSSSGKPKSTNKSRDQKPHSCDNPEKCNWCKRNNRSALGLCEQLTCDNPLSPKSTRRCEDHLRKQNSAQVNYRKKKAEDHKCTYCPEQAIPGQTKCPRHVEYRRKARAKHNAERKRQLEPQLPQASSSARATTSQPATSQSYRQGHGQSPGMAYPQGQYPPSNAPQSIYSQMGQVEYQNGFTQPQNQPSSSYRGHPSTWLWN